MAQAEAAEQAAIQAGAEAAREKTPVEEDGDYEEAYSEDEEQ